MFLIVRVSLGDFSGKVYRIVDLVRYLCLRDLGILN